MHALSDHGAVDQSAGKGGLAAGMRQIMAMAAEELERAYFASGAMVPARNWRHFSCRNATSKARRWKGSFWLV